MCLATPQQETSMTRPRPVFRVRSGFTPPGFGCARLATLPFAPPHPGGVKPDGRKTNYRKQITPAHPVYLFDTILHKSVVAGGELHQMPFIVCIVHPKMRPAILPIPISIIAPHIPPPIPTNESHPLEAFWDETGIGRLVPMYLQLHLASRSPQHTLVRKSDGSIDTDEVPGLMIFCHTHPITG